MSNLEYCLWLVMVFGAANPKIWKMIECFKNPENAFKSLSSSDYDFISEKEKNAVKTTHIQQCIYVLENCKKKNIKAVCFFDEDYPKSLENISNPPVVIFMKGDTTVFNDLCITVVGTREPSVYSIRIAEKICSELAKIGVVIVSGFALGIDSVSHRSAIVSGGRTIAVLGCGIDVDYPKENTKSKAAIASHGLFISEFLPGTRPLPSNFPKRNRILSALSAGTLVIEASRKSGSLITAELALEQGKDLFCVPPSDIFDERYSGVVKFLRDGAIPVFSYLDIVYEYYVAFAHKLSANDDYSEPASSSSVFSAEKHDKKTIRKKSVKSADKPDKADDKPVETDIKPDYSGLDENETEIVKILSDGIKYIDEISVMTGKEISELYIMLTDMEIDGIIECLPGKAYKLI